MKLSTLGGAGGEISQTQDRLEESQFQRRQERSFNEAVVIVILQRRGGR